MTDEEVRQGYRELFAPPGIARSVIAGALLVGFAGYELVFEEDMVLLVTVEAPLLLFPVLLAWSAVVRRRRLRESENESRESLRLLYLAELRKRVGQESLWDVVIIIVLLAAALMVATAIRRIRNGEPERDWLLKVITPLLALSTALYHRRVVHPRLRRELDALEGRRHLPGESPGPATLP